MLKDDKEGIVHCWEKTKLLCAWYRSVQVEAFTKKGELFPNLEESDSYFPQTEDEDAGDLGVPFTQPESEEEWMGSSTAASAGVVVFACLCICSALMLMTHGVFQHRPCAAPARTGCPKGRLVPKWPVHHLSNTVVKLLSNFCDRNCPPSAAREGGSAPDPGCAPNPTGSDDPPRPAAPGGTPFCRRCRSIDSVLVERPYTYRTFYSAG